MSVACRFVPEHIAEDIVQSVFVMYWEQKSTLTPNAIHSFLYKCTQNNCLNYLKHQAVVLGHEEEVRLAEERMAFQLEDRMPMNCGMRWLSVTSGNCWKLPSLNYLLNVVRLSNCLILKR